MANLRRIAAVWAGKFLGFCCRLAGRKGTSLPGRTALALCPNLLRDLAAEVKKEIIVVCGTDGKTTTNNLLYHALSAAGYSVAANLRGANMLSGVCGAFLARTDLLGHLHADYAALEVDEFSAVRVFDHLQPDIILLINLFRDQLDRYGEIDTIIASLRRAFAKCPDAKLVLNADDPLSASFGYQSEHPCFYAGMEEKTQISSSDDEVREGRFCLFCGKPLEYEYFHYSQLGMYRCTGCDFARPAVTLAIRNVCRTACLSFTLEMGEEQRQAVMPGGGLYNAYNLGMAILAGSLALGTMPNVEKTLEDYRPQAGRLEHFCIGEKEVCLNMAKNPAGFNQALMALQPQQGAAVLLALNDNPPDGRDISWIWDVNFETLAQSGRRFVLTGLRADELAVRMKYAGLPLRYIYKIPVLEEAVKALLDGPETSCCMLANYTAVYPLRHILKREERRRRNEKR